MHRILIVLSLIVPAVCQVRRSAPTFYIATTVHECEAGEITIRGATNLPAGAMLLLEVKGIEGKEMRMFSGRSKARVYGQGFFVGSVKPLPRQRFRDGLIVTAIFDPSIEKQPTNVLAEVGRKGEKLDMLHNPQAFQRSGWWYYLVDDAITQYCGLYREATPAP